MAKKDSFEEQLKELQSYSDKIKKKDITLDEAISCYENGIKAYEKCKKILDDTKAKINYYDEETGELIDSGWEA